LQKRDASVSFNRSTHLSSAAVAAISETLRQLLADVFVLYVKTKNFHWHMSGPHFRDYHLLLDEQATELFAMTDAIAERGRKIGGMTLLSISDIARHQRLLDNNDQSVPPHGMIEELAADGLCLTKLMRAAHGICQEFQDVATTSLIEVWIDQAERRTWFLHATLHGRTEKTQRKGERS
jgi:starvation-inducible DNA-binding protein